MEASDADSDFAWRAMVAPETDDGLPLEWTPEHVVKRLRAAFDVLRRTGMAIGPRGHANAWPAMLLEFSDQVDEQTRKQIERDTQEALSRRADRPTAEEVDMAEEALAWPLKYLTGQPMPADAICLFTAFPQQVESILRNRMALAIKKAAVASRQENEIREARLATAVKATRLWADIKIRAVPPSPDRAEKIDAIKNRARIKLEREVKRKNARLAPVNFPPKVGMPNKILSRFNLDVQRKIGAAIIAEALQGEKVSVR